METGVLPWPEIPGRELTPILKTVASSAAPEALSPTRKLVRKITFYGCKDLDRTPNTGSVFIGYQLKQIQQLVPYEPTLAGGEVVLQGQGPDLIDLSKVYIDVATNGDGVVGVYLE
jgi:hypothetical protein